MIGKIKTAAFDFKCNYFKPVQCIFFVRLVTEATTMAMGKFVPIDGLIFKWMLTISIVLMMAASTGKLRTYCLSLCARRCHSLSLRSPLHIRIAILKQCHCSFFKGSGHYWKLFKIMISITFFLVSNGELLMYKTL